MNFAHGVTVKRLRRARVTDPYNPSNTTTGPWDDTVQSIDLPGAYMEAVAQTLTPDPTRVQRVMAWTLFCDPDADVRAGDRIVWGPQTFAVTTWTPAPQNPFTGWRPVAAIPLEEVTG